jgi:hypothetical protein
MPWAPGAVIATSPENDIPIFAPTSVFGRGVWNRTLAYPSDGTLLSGCGLSHTFNFVKTAHQDR